MATWRSHTQRLCQLVFFSAACLVLPTLQANPAPKNIILLIGDGMGMPQLGLLESYARQAPNSRYQGQPTAISQLASQGKTLYSLTHPYDALVVDSACSATQLAIGEACRNEMIGLNAQGHPVETLLEKARRLGKSTGLVSDTRLTHATPAAFAAHQAHRSMEAAIAKDMLHNQVDVLFSGGLSYFLPQDEQLISQQQHQLIQRAQLNVTSKRKDNLNLLSQAEQLNYQLAFSSAQLQAIEKPPVLGLFSQAAMPDALSEKHQPQRSFPSLEEMTIKALSLLEQNPKGFFLMVEAGQIDWTGHNNDAGGMLHELLKFDQVVSRVLAWAAKRNDTLIVLTADHETGGFGFSYSHTPSSEPLELAGAAFAKQPYQASYNFAAPELLDRLYQQRQGSYRIWQEAQAQGKNGKATVASLRQAVQRAMPFTLSKAQAQRILSAKQPLIDDFSEFYVYLDEAPLNQLARELASQQNVVWSTGTHTAAPVPVIISGPDATLQQFQGILTHTELGAKLKGVLD